MKLQAWTTTKLFATKFRIELFVFSLIFTIVVSQMRFPTYPASRGTVEQWVNLTNQMFYGEQDFLFSYGPMFWLTGGAASQYSRLTYLAAVLFCGIVYGYFWSLLAILSYRSNAYLFFGLTFFLFFTGLAHPSAFFLWPLATVFYIQFTRRDLGRLSNAILVIFGLLAGVEFYVRFFHGMLAVITLGSYLFTRFLYSRKIAELVIFIVTVIVSYVAFGLLIFHQSGSLIDYVLINSQLNFGNSVDMTLGIENARISFVEAAIVAILVDLYLVIYCRSLLITANVLLLLFLKMGFSRTDHFIDYFVVPASIVALALVFEKKSLGRVLYVGVLCSLFFLTAKPSYVGAPTRNAFIPATDFKQGYADRMAAAYVEFKLPDDVLIKIGNAPIEVYPYNNEYMFANKLKYAHRPLFQNYMTLTPALDKTNMTFFASENRPEFILWTAGTLCGSPTCNPFDGFDSKYALNEDPLTSSGIFLNYHVVQTFATKNGMPAILLQQNAKYVKYAAESIRHQIMSFGTWYEVPQPTSGVIKLSPEFKFKPLGKLKNSLFRGNTVFVKYRLANGQIKEYRINILNATSGIWSTPFLNNLNLQGERVDAIMLDTDGSSYLDRTFEADWIKVPLPAITTRPMKNTKIGTTAPDGMTNTTTRLCDGTIDAVNGLAPPPTRISMSDTLSIRGWLAISAKAGTVPDKIFLTFTDGKGSVRYVDTHRESRPDVSENYHQAALVNSGFGANVDISGLREPVSLGIAQMIRGEIQKCSQFTIALDVAR